ncbi:uncharacterized protein LOC127002823 isoform X2 [Eriocheir sinensis]|uniref:uncharacterized protein LOC127002823 isoform X2 n=1 Tax=Eriocheir sinensis TaxID=95602 RepID=UPI0021C7BC4F|nr:uncharacterized protein LOC127002823 isoform X2 [Eriocheir sinensis]
MASPSDRREGEETGKAEADVGEVKPGQMDLFAAMLASLRQELDQRTERAEQRADERAREQAQRAEERADERAREQAQRAEERADERARHLAEVLQSSLSSLKAETQQYTDKACDSVKSELLGEVQTLKGEVQGLREEVEAERQRRELATSRGEEQEASRVLAASTRVTDLLGSSWGPWQEPLGPRSVVSEPAAAAGGWGAIGAAPLGPTGARVGPTHPASLPPSPPPSPCRPAHSPRAPFSPPSSPSASRRSGRRKPAEYDGKVAWEAYVAQFEMLAAAQGWDEAEKALQLATALRGPAVEVLGHLPPAQRASYGSMAEALRRRFGHHLQAEVYRARLKKRTRERGETLSQLAQDVEALVSRSYPAAPEEMIVVLARDFFVDALHDQQLQTYVKQAHPGDLQVALARALEFEAFLKTTSGLGAAPQPRRDLRGRKAKVEKKATSRKASPDGFLGSCWGCGKKGHMRSRCPRERRTRSLDRLSSDAFQPCCKDCGKSGHRSSACPKPKEVVQAGNRDRLEKGAESQPSVPGPRLA